MAAVPWGQIAQTGGDLIGSIISAFTTQDINRQNVAFAKEQQGYDRQLQQTMFGREDNAIQRRRRDLEAAGLSPVLAAGQGAQAGPVVGSSAPQINRVPEFGDIAKSIGRMPGAALDLEAAVLRNEQLGASIAQTRAQTALTESQTENQKLEGKYREGTLQDRITKMFHEAGSSESGNISGQLRNILERMQTTARMGASATGENPIKLSPRELQLGLDPTRQDEKTRAEIQKARADARAAGIGAEFDQLMLDYERDIGRLLRGAGEVGNILKTGLGLLGNRTPRSTVIRVQGR